MDNKQNQKSNTEPIVKRHIKPTKSESTEGSEFVDDSSEKFERSDEANQNKHGGSLETT